MTGFYATKNTLKVPHIRFCFSPLYWSPIRFTTVLPPGGKLATHVGRITAPLLIWISQDFYPRISSQLFKTSLERFGEKVNQNLFLCLIISPETKSFHPLVLMRLLFPFFFKIYNSLTQISGCLPGKKNMILLKEHTSPSNKVRQTLTNLMGFFCTLRNYNFVTQICHVYTMHVNFP